MSLPRLYDEDDQTTRERELVFLRAALEESLPRGRDILVVTIGAPAESLEKFLRLVPREMGFLWRSPSGGVRMAGGGSAITLETCGDNRLDTLEDAATSLWQRIHRIARQSVPVKPALFGGIAFAPNVATIEPWEEFTHDAFSLARWTYHRVGRDAFLTLTVRDEERRDAVQVDAFVAEARRLLTALETESPTSLIDRHDIPRSAVHHVPLEDWVMFLESILAAIRSGQYDKIVAGRRCVVDLKRPLDDTGFIARLSAAYPDCIHFAVRREQSTFVGATPETLFRKVGVKLTTHALAGTIRVEDDPGSSSDAESETLRQSTKDLAEHEFVVKRICEELGPVSTKVRYGSSPEARHVRNLVHLQTPIEAELRPATTLFDLLAAFHPTPAVGGFPAKEAATWIRLNEPLERGWYTGTVGWFDADGDGEFAVAIRCGVLTPKRAHLYAGAGIVERSDPEAEYAETAAKMQPMLRALGVTL